MFGIISSKVLRDEAGRVVDEFTRACPPPGKTRPQPISDLEMSRSLDELFRHVATIARTRRLGVLGRARFAKALQDEFRRLEYPNELVSRVVNAVTVNSLVSPGRG